MMDQDTAVQTYCDDERVSIPDSIAPRYAVIDACIRAGIQQSTIAKGLRVTDGSITHAKNKLKSKYSLTSTSLVKLAHSAVKQTLQGAPVGQSDPPKAANIIAAAQMVYDRAEPTKQADTGTQNITFTQVNIELSNVDTNQGTE
jgi:hypothetical protein